MQLFRQVKNLNDAHQIIDDVFVNLYHVSSIEPTEENNVTLISLTNGKSYYVEGNYAQIAANISRKDFSRR